MPLCSFRLDVRRPDHLGPLLGVFCNKFAEVGWRALKCRAAEVDKSSLQFRVSEARVDFLVELLDYYDGRILWRADPEQSACLVAGHEICHRRNVWQGFRARGG